MLPIKSPLNIQWSVMYKVFGWLAVYVDVCFMRELKTYMYTVLYTYINKLVSNITSIVYLSRASSHKMFEMNASSKSINAVEVSVSPSSMQLYDIFRKHTLASHYTNGIGNKMLHGSKCVQECTEGGVFFLFIHSTLHSTTEVIRKRSRHIS